MNERYCILRIGVLCLFRKKKFFLFLGEGVGKPHVL